MPELPEVETIKRQLNREIKDKKIEKVKVNLPKLVRYPLAKFEKLVKGAIIKNVNRRAKLLIVELSNGYVLVVHLKLTGQLIFNGEIGKHTHLVYYFTDGSFLVHNDLRQFGFVKVISKAKLDEFFKKEKFGPEPLSREFTLKVFKKYSEKRKRSKIKPLLMDQSFISGIGNLYADEILFKAGVRPDRIVDSLKSLEVKKIYQAILKILPLAISRGGSSIDTYRDARGKKGNYLSLIKVYQRGSNPCFICKSKIKRIKMSSRSAHFCPKCQK